MSLAFIGIVGIIVLLLVLFFFGMPVGFAMAVVGFSGFWYVVSFKAALSMVGTDIWVTFSKYGLTVLPLFIFMGYLAFNSGLGERLYKAAYNWVYIAEEDGSFGIHNTEYTVKLLQTSYRQLTGQDVPGADIRM